MTAADVRASAGAASTDANLAATPAGTTGTTGAGERADAARGSADAVPGATATEPAGSTAAADVAREDAAAGASPATTPAELDAAPDQPADARRGPPDTEAEGEPAEAADGDSEPAAAARTWRARIHRLAVSRAALPIGVLCGLLGFGLAVQVQSNTASNGLAAARQEDLVRILDDLSSREERLRRQISSLEAARSRLTTTGDKNTAALAEARSRSVSLGILAGTLPAQGPGIQLTMNDPARQLKAEDVLDAVEELRAAGAEAIQVGPVRIGLNSSFTDVEGADGPRIQADGQDLPTPYRLLAIGDPATLATALNIPGGIVDTVRQAGGRATIGQQDRLVIRVLRPLSTPHYAQPADGSGSGGN